ncbi:LOB domain-containing protein 12 [Acorus calamus]|uniref:LOB domain-containing protein 12 n=1 Tax=Acorus calamus TaxID=4465 RepID=A0AAV9ERA0_ACOCL|nr:LOB domain-containing protein 12 [Acorus calamus]
MMSAPTRCAACKYLRRRCSEDCVLAPYFPSKDPQRFACVHKIFGATNVAKMLQQLPVEQRRDAANSISFEACWRIRDPVYGCVAIISHLHQQIYTAECELSKTQAQLAIHGARRTAELNQPAEVAPAFLYAHQEQEHLLPHQSLALLELHQQVPEFY